MVLMLFDLKHETQAFTRGKITGAIKIASVGILAGLVVGAITIGKSLENIKAVADNAQAADTTKILSENLFLKNVFGFEALGVVLLVIAIGAVALSRSKGGTHAK